ncbi:hypothetical protein PHMEG_00034487 [Phytophthora megakarya]|uniref:Uncharacterized protein n=1 Tax=Phytophthora megakarya TaxID=4795 RepID=A0A225UQX5_9STRA|nr:hypothetical protein PHMEG_00034487 [Phytophthora megakarya]
MTINRQFDHEIPAVHNVVSWKMGSMDLGPIIPEWSRYARFADPAPPALAPQSTKDWFWRNGFEVSEPDLLKLAVKNSHLNTVRWLSKHGYEINSLDLVEMPRSKGNISLFRWIVEYGLPLGFQMARTLAVTHNCVEI